MVGGSGRTLPPPHPQGLGKSCAAAIVADRGSSAKTPYSPMYRGGLSTATCVCCVCWGGCGGGGGGSGESSPVGHLAVGLGCAQAHPHAGLPPAALSGGAGAEDDDLHLEGSGGGQDGTAAPSSVCVCLDPAPCLPRRNTSLSSRAFVVPRGRAGARGHGPPHAPAHRASDEDVEVVRGVTLVADHLPRPEHRQLHLGQERLNVPVRPFAAAGTERSPTRVERNSNSTLGAPAACAHTSASTYHQIHCSAFKENRILSHQPTCQLPPPTYNYSRVIGSDPVVCPKARVYNGRGLYIEV